MLSYSDFGEHRSDERGVIVRRAEYRPATQTQFIIDGEMQADTAVNTDKLRTAFRWTWTEKPPC